MSVTTTSSCGTWRCHKIPPSVRCKGRRWPWCRPWEGWGRRRAARAARRRRGAGQSKASRQIGLPQRGPGFPVFPQRSIARDHLQDTTLSVTQRLGQPAFGHVHQDTHEFGGGAGCVENRMAHSMHVFRPTVWKKKSELSLEILSRGVRSLGAFNDLSSIFRMHTLYHFFE